MVSRRLPVLSVFCMAAMSVGLALPVTTSARLPPAALNHLYVVLDQASFDAIQHSDSVARLLSPPDTGLPGYAAPDDGADRLFLRGRTTYLELFAPGNRFGEPVGKVGLAIGHDAPGDLDRLETAWRAVYRDVRRSDVHWRRTTPPVPWYDAVQRDATADNPHLVLWAMTYRPELVAWLAPSAAATPRTSRADVLAPRWRHAQGLIDIVGVHVGVPGPLRQQLDDQLSQAGFDRRTSGEDLVFEGLGWTLHLVETDAPGLRALDLQTAPRTDGACTMDWGSTRLMLADDGGSRWWFAGRSPAQSAPVCPNATH